MTPASLLGDDDPAFNPRYTEEQKKFFRENPKEHNKYRKKIIHNINAGFKMVTLTSTVDALQLTSCNCSSLRGRLRTLKCSNWLAIRWRKS